MDKEFLIPAFPVEEKKGWFPKNPLRNFFLINKLHSPLGYLFLFVVLAGVGIGVAKFGIIFGYLVLAGAIAIPVVYALVAYPKIGITVFLIASYFIMLFLRMGVNFPLGTLMDGMEVLFLIGLLIKQKQKPDWKIYKGPISKLMIIWMIYNILEVANPIAASRLAWVYTVRTVAIIMIMYFIFLYHIRTKEFIKFIIKLWLVLAFIGAAYCFKQEHFGFFDFEERYIHSDPAVGLLLFIGGHWRKFSMFSDPVVFAYTMAICCLLCMGLLTGPVSPKKKAILVFLLIFYFMNMVYSGTRGAFVLVPVGMIIFAILRFTKTILAITIAFGICLFVVVNMPTSNQSLYRFQTAFKPSDDPSYKLRKINQKRVQPFIQTHPLGGGLGSTGEWGGRFSPGTFLAIFQPDSGYARVIVESGWIGMFLLCTLMFTVLKTGINNYYKLKDPELKSYCLAFTTMIFALHIGNYPQEALVQFPSNVFFYLMVAIISGLPAIERDQIERQNAAKRIN